MNCVIPLWSPPAQAAHGVVVLLDTNDRYDAWNTGRDGPEDWRDGMGLRIAYDGTGAIPGVVFNGPDGEIQLTGCSEIRAATQAIEQANRYAEAFDPPRRWRGLQRVRP
jgi:hypothetical protein